MNVPENLRYRDSHEWVHTEGDARTVGITDHAQDELTDIVFVELPEVGTEFAAGDAAAVVESVKAASDIYAPVAGKVVEVNTALDGEPGLINTSPYENGWLFKIEPADAAEIDGLMSSADYQSHIG